MKTNFVTNSMGISGKEKFCHIILSLMLRLLVVPRRLPRRDSRRLLCGNSPRLLLEDFPRLRLRDFFASP